MGWIECANGHLDVEYKAVKCQISSINNGGSGLWGEAKGLA